MVVLWRGEDEEERSEARRTTGGERQRSRVVVVVVSAEDLSVRSEGGLGRTKDWTDGRREEVEGKEAAAVDGELCVRRPKN